MSGQETGEATGSRALPARPEPAYGAKRAAAGSPASPLANHAPVAWLVAGLLALGFAGALVSLAASRNDGATFDLHGWRDGTLGRQIDRAIDVPYARGLHGWEAAVRYRLFGDLGLQVMEGCPGWLFYRDGLRPLGDDGGEAATDPLIDARIAALDAYASALRAAGIALVVATVPDKARVETDALCGLAQAPVMTRRLARWQHALDEAGVAHVDLLPALQQARPAFYRTDVHWNARGAEAAAQVLATAVLPRLGTRGDTRFVHAQAPAAPRVGDLLQLAGLADAPDGWRPAPDVETTETLTPVRAGGLLDAGPGTEVMLAGSSFSRRSAFADRLGEQLGREVWNVSLDDGQFDRALHAMWAKRASWPASVRVVIWEMSEDALSMPVADEPRTGAPQAAANPPVPAPGAAHEAPSARQD
ncbi:alginate O-acetyltransferase AlgX-related protein [Paraburkholderia sp. J12]|uniref:alginate O-acetyltransferase AlgX-related protein n=1 Tax=Paraburkholderia sp. J12 TaxID=2805432 RepID=UPI002ABE0DCD|nr:cell division protein FtsQ [Paraburkholderia sp. J12]